MKKQSLLYIAVLIPLFMIIVTMLSLLWYQKDLHPNNDFVYLASESYEAFYCLEQIKSEIYPEQPKPKAHQPNCDRAQLYVYHFNTQSSTPITRAEIAKLKLNLTSPEHYQIEPYYGSGSDFLWPFINGSYAPDFSLVKGQYRKKLSIRTGSLQRNFYALQFIGWIDNPPHT